jgi:hypothetical protein
MSRANNAVLVHGARADDPHWEKVIPAGLAEGSRATA